MFEKYNNYSFVKLYPNCPILHQEYQNEIIPLLFQNLHLFSDKLPKISLSSNVNIDWQIILKFSEFSFKYTCIRHPGFFFHYHNLTTRFLHCLQEFLIVSTFIPVTYTYFDIIPMVLGMKYTIHPYGRYVHEAILGQWYALTTWTSQYTSQSEVSFSRLS